MLHLNHVLQVWGKTGAKLYGPTTGTDYRDNQLRFCLLCLVSNPVNFWILIIQEYTAIQQISPFDIIFVKFNLIQLFF